MQPPDFSEYIVHFTKDTHLISEVVSEINSLSAKDRLLKILETTNIRATKMPWTNKPAVCFTECTWASLLYHADRYSKYGIGFHKSYVFSKDGGPAIYLSPSLMQYKKEHVGTDKYPFDQRLFAFITPFIPSYASREYKNTYWKRNGYIDFSQEREWRVPHDLTFSLEDVAFVIVDTYNDMATSPKPYKDKIGRENWLIMSNYKKIETFWPIHRLPK
jgi:hypothetical protein